MKTVSQQPYLNPHAFITINRQKQKIYNDETYFMNDGDEFEIELNNPTTEFWAAKLKINNEWVSDVGIELRPGERVWLDTPDLTSPNKRKFKFSVYSVDEKNINAARFNGNVEIFFYKKTNHSYVAWSSIDFNGGASPIYYSNSNYSDSQPPSNIFSGKSRPWALHA